MRSDEGRAPGGKLPRVLFVAHDSLLYGAQRSLLDLLARIKGYEPYVVAPSAGPFTDELRSLGVPFTTGLVQRWIYFPKPMTLRAILRRPWRRLNHPFLLALLSFLSLPVRVGLLALLIRRKRIDIVYTNTATVLDGALAARLCGIPHVWHLREAVEGNPDLVSPIPVGWLPGFALSFSAAVVTNSGSLARRIFGEGAEPKVRVIHNGTDVAIYSAPQDDPLPDLPKGIRLAVVCGSVQERKDILTYVRSAARLRESHPTLHHLLVGQGREPYLSRVREAIEHAGLAERIHFLGYRADVPALLARVDLLISTAVDEPFGRTLIEAMAAGLPVVSTRSGGPQEILVDGECGFLADVGDDAAVARCIARLLDDVDLYARMSGAARERVGRHFELGACVRTMERVFDEVLQAR